MATRMTPKEFAGRVRALAGKYQQFNKMFIDELSKMGYDVANVKFANAVYAGVNDVEVTLNKDGNNDKQSAVISANGYSVLFIEFGSGITKTDAWDERRLSDKPITEHGEYGYKRGSNPSGWEYYGEVGKNPPSDTIIVKTTNKGTLVRTMGNNATHAMYDARKAILNAYLKTAKEIFGGAF